MARPIGQAPPHGTRRRYQYRPAPCRCTPCTTANATYVRNWRRGWEQLEIERHHYEPVGSPA